MKQALDDLIDEAELTHAEIGAELGITSSAVYNKLARRRRWYQAEIDKFLALLTKKTGRSVTYEEAFGKRRRDRAAVAR